MNMKIKINTKVFNNKITDEFYYAYTPQEDKIIWIVLYLPKNKNVALLEFLAKKIVEKFLNDDNITVKKLNEILNDSNKNYIQKNFYNIENNESFSVVIVMSDYKNLIIGNIGNAFKVNIIKDKETISFVEESKIKELSIDENYMFFVSKKSLLNKLSQEEITDTLLKNDRENALKKIQTNIELLESKGNENDFFLAVNFRDNDDQVMTNILPKLKEEKKTNRLKLIFLFLLISLILLFFINLLTLSIRKKNKKRIENELKVTINESEPKKIFPNIPNIEIPIIEPNDTQNISNETPPKEEQPTPVKSVKTIKKPAKKEKQNINKKRKTNKTIKKTDTIKIKNISETEDEKCSLPPRGDENERQ